MIVSMTMLRLHEVCRICTKPETQTNKLISLLSEGTSSNWLRRKLSWYLPAFIPRDNLWNAAICQSCLTRFKIYLDFLVDCYRGQQYFEKFHRNMTPYDTRNDETTAKEKSSDRESSERSTPTTLSIKKEIPSDEDENSMKFDESLPLNLSQRSQSKTEILAAPTPVIVYSSSAECSSLPSTSKQVKSLTIPSQHQQQIQQPSSRRELVCAFCDKKLYHRGDYNKHLRKHTKEKPYECDVCAKKFAHSSNLTRHKLVHSGELPFECDKCHKRFNRKDKLATHKKCRSS